MVFRARYSPEVPQLLNQLNISLILTTYQAGKVIVLSSDGNKLIQLLRDFDRPMGLALLAVSGAMARWFRVRRRL